MTKTRPHERPEVGLIRVALLSFALVPLTATVARAQTESDAIVIMDASQPLSISGNQFHPHLRGAVVCCMDEDIPGGPDQGTRDGWPLIKVTPLNQFNSAGLTVTHFRTGPYADPGTWGAGYDILVHLSGKVASANARGIYVEVDLVDSWALKHAGTNFFGDRCAVTHGAPPQRYLDWVKAVVDATGDKGVLYNLGNESFACQTSVAWETGLYNAVKNELRAKGWPDRPVGSEFLIDAATLQPRGGATAFDYRSVGDTAPGVYVQALQRGTIPRDRPVILVESDNAAHTPAEWHQDIAAAEALGAYIMVWRGAHMTDSDFQAAYNAP
jgi:hypothetical protein